MFIHFYLRATLICMWATKCSKWLSMGQPVFKGFVILSVTVNLPFPLQQN